MEETLDPQDWDAMRALGHRMVDDMMQWLESVRERPVWQPLPPSARAALQGPVPRHGQLPAAVYDDFVRDVLPYPMGNVHPRFWGWVIGTGTPLGALAEMLAATMNPNVGGGDHAANHVELQVLGWFKELIGFPPDASGLLVSGGSMANLVGLTVARDARAEVDVRQAGVQQVPRRMVLYASSETHNSVRKAVAVLGLGWDALREIPVDADLRIDLRALEAAIAADRAAGHLPFCVVGNAGTVNSGAIDPLPQLADLCRAEGLWFHVDGAFGALAALAPELRPLVAGLERADSLAFDLHKWMYVPYEAGCALVRHPEQHQRAFTAHATYLTHAERGLAAGPPWFSEYGMQLSRGFRALKVWMSLKEHGADKYGRLVHQNVEQARHFAHVIDATDDLEMVAPVPLNIVCFRYLGAGANDEARLEALNEEILMQLQESGVAILTSTRIHGRFALRAAITNHRSRREDVELVARTVQEFGRRIERGTPLVS